MQPDACSLRLVACSSVPGPLTSAHGQGKPWPLVVRVFYSYFPFLRQLIRLRFREAFSHLLLISLHQPQDLFQGVCYSVQLLTSFIYSYFTHNYSFLNASYIILEPLSSAACCLRLEAQLSPSLE